MSLDHDLGWCSDCIRQGAHLRHSGKRHCPHTPTGYDLTKILQSRKDIDELEMVLRTLALDPGEHDVLAVPAVLAATAAPATAAPAQSERDRANR